MSVKQIVLVGVWGLMGLSGCQFTEPDPRTDDTPTSGHILILADEDCRAVLDEEALVFRNIYADAVLDIRYMGEAELLKAMMNDSVRCVVTSVDPGGAQQAYFDKRRISAPIVPIYKAGIAVVVNRNSPLQRFDLLQIAALLGETIDVPAASEFDKPTTSDSLTALFAGAGSGVARLLVDSLHIGTLRARALADVNAVIAQVARDPGAVGFLPFEAISDLDNPAMLALQEQVRILPIAGAPGEVAVLPSQSSLANGTYPLKRTVNMVLTEGKSGLGTGFVSFVANHKGQRIILKLGVAPINVPPRDIQIVQE
ncbi:MAG: PstS family phosphate ABC transporter substrate-binding protein [Flavobacteriales bacterium]